MKKFLALAAAAAALVSVSSCDTRPNPSGEWSGRVSDNVPGLQSTVDMTINFSQDGKVNANYAIVSVKDFNGNGDVVTPFQARVTASVTESGIWQYVDGEDDEIIVKFDPSTIDVQISPDQIEYLVDELTDQQVAETRALTAAAIEKYKKAYKADFGAKNSTFLLEDVKVHENMMKFEIGDRDYVFTGARAK